MKKIITIGLIVLSFACLRVGRVEAQTPGWEYAQCSLISVTLSTSYQKVATCVSSVSWPYALGTSWYIFPVGMMDVTINSSTPADIALQIRAENPPGQTGCTNSAAAGWDYFQFVPNQRQLWPVNEILRLSAGPSLFPSTGCAVDLWAKTSVTSTPPTLNVGSTDGTNLAVIIVNQPT
jgi:hypothetical protein